MAQTRVENWGYPSIVGLILVVHFPLQFRFRQRACVFLWLVHFGVYGLPPLPACRCAYACLFSDAS